MQGMGWLTTEELVFDAQGRLRTHAPSTYKIPCASDVPADFRVKLLRVAGQQGRHDLPLQGRGRTAADAGHFSLDGDLRRRRQPEAGHIPARCAGDTGGHPAGREGNGGMKVWSLHLRRAGSARHLRHGLGRARPKAPSRARQGARMVVTPQGFHGTIGGGTLEWKAIAEAQRLLGKPRAVKMLHAMSLGPDLGQCCGGRVSSLTESLRCRSLPR